MNIFFNMIIRTYLITEVFFHFTPFELWPNISSLQQQ